MWRLYPQCLHCWKQCKCSTRVYVCECECACASARAWLIEFVMEYILLGCKYSWQTPLVKSPKQQGSCQYQRRVIAPLYICTKVGKWLHRWAIIACFLFVFVVVFIEFFFFFSPLNRSRITSKRGMLWWYFVRHLFHCISCPVFRKSVFLLVFELKTLIRLTITKA